MSQASSVTLISQRQVELNFQNPKILFLRFAWTKIPHFHVLTFLGTAEFWDAADALLLSHTCLAPDETLVKDLRVVTCFLCSSVCQSLMNWRCAPPSRLRETDALVGVATATGLRRTTPRR